MKLVIALAGAVLFPSLAVAAPTKAVQVVKDKAGFVRKLRAAKVPERQGIDKSLTDHDDGHTRSFPHFTSSFTRDGVSYPFTMVGHAPQTGRSTTIRTVIVPLRMHFVGFDVDATFEPGTAVDNIVNSPMFKDAPFPNGVGQFGDQLQRATFWNQMDEHKSWHVRLDRPRITKAIDIQVEPDIGELFQVGPNPTDVIGNLRFGAIDSTIHTALQFIHVDPDEVPIFVTYNVTADALGYHDAFTRPGDDDSSTLQTIIYTSWLEDALVGDLLADVSTFNHELAEWLNDPFVNNIVPTWEFPPANTTCGDNPFLEVGDPQGNGPDFALFPTVPITLRGVTYHLQDVVMLPWFSGAVPSTALNGWYDFPDTHQITTPSVECPL